MFYVFYIPHALFMFISVLLFYRNLLKSFYEQIPELRNCSPQTTLVRSMR